MAQKARRWALLFLLTLLALAAISASYWTWRMATGTRLRGAHPVPSATPIRSSATAAPLLTEPELTPTPEIHLTDTPAPSPTPEEFTFAVAGDSRGGDPIYLEILRRVVEDGAAFLIHTGDLVNVGGEAEFQHFAALMQVFPLPFFPAAGNHDAQGGALDQFLRYSGASAAHYSFDHLHVHVTVIDSHHGSLSNAELDWMEADLSSSPDQLKIVVLHHPPFDPDGTDHILAGGNEAFMAIVEEQDVEVVFAGHIHAFAEGERSGVRYIITGGAGAPLYAGGHPHAYHHYLRVHVRGTELEVEVIPIFDVNGVSFHLDPAVLLTPRHPVPRAGSRS